MNPEHVDYTLIWNNLSAPTSKGIRCMIGWSLCALAIRCTALPVAKSHTCAHQHMFTGMSGTAIKFNFNQDTPGHHIIYVIDYIVLPSSVDFSLTVACFNVPAPVVMLLMGTITFFIYILA